VNYISWKISRADYALIGMIVTRARTRFRDIDPLALQMDLIACHANGTPLRLADLLAADSFDFWHDVNGIQRHIDRGTGKLRDCFLPRFFNHVAAGAA
jgi:hypothetical protein